MSYDQLRRPENRARTTEASRARRLPTRPTTRPGSETTNLTPGNPVRIARTGVLWAPNGRNRGDWYQGADDRFTALYGAHRRQSDDTDELGANP